MTYTDASLRLFNAVIRQPNAKKTSKYHIDYDTGVFVHPSAMQHQKQIGDYLRNAMLNGVDINKTFCASWATIATQTLENQIESQIKHYMSTYGSEWLDPTAPLTVYLPDDGIVKNIPENRIGLRVIRGMLSADMSRECLAMLSSGVALKQSTVNDLLVVLDACDYVFTGSEKVSNKEAIVLIAEKTGILLSNSPTDLLRIFMYRATGNTMIIKSKATLAGIRTSGYQIPDLTPRQYAELSSIFNRTKPIWLAFKQADTKNRRVINRISKLSKINHQPMKPSVLNTLTNYAHKAKVIASAAKTSTSFEVVRALNAVRYYSAGTKYRAYRIRNGRSWATSKGVSVVKSPNAEAILLKELQSRLGDKTIYMPPGLDYAIPTSEKNFSGGLPQGTSFRAPMVAGGHLMVGVYWENAKTNKTNDSYRAWHTGSRVDLDLSGMSAGERIGWNTRWCDGTGAVMYSGDVTDAANGAAEWLYFGKQITEPFLVTLNNFCGNDGHPFKLILAYGTKAPAKNYMVDPNRVLFQADCVMDTSQQLLGMISPTEDGSIDFTLINEAMGGGIISLYGKNEDAIMQSMITKRQTALTLRDVVNVVDDPEKADIDLSLSEVSIAKMLGIFDEIKSVS